MAHIPDGVLSAPVLVAGALVSTGLLAYALGRLDYDRLPHAAVLSAAFFVSSLISIPLGPGSAHLLLNGLMGLLLGWTALPALFVALLLQAAFFGFGGVVVLGVNTANTALPALVCAIALRPLLAKTLAEALRGQQEAAAAPGCGSVGHWVGGSSRRGPTVARRPFWIGAAAGALGVLLTAALVALSLVLSGKSFLPAAQVLVIIYLPLALVEGLITGTVVAFLHRVAPELLSDGEESHA